MNAQQNRPNQFAQPCAVCGVRVPAGMGVLGGRAPSYTVHCQDCYRRSRETPSLSRGCAVLSLLPNDEVAASIVGYVPNKEFSQYLAATASTGFYFDNVRKAQIGSIRGTMTIIRELQRANFDVKVTDPKLTRRLGELAVVAQKEIDDTHARADAVDVRLAKQNLKLYPFQRTSASWLSPRKCALVGHSPGLGKTVISLTSLPAGAPVLIVAPVSIKLNWLKEICQFRPDYGSCRIKKRGDLEYIEPVSGVVVLEGRDSFRWPAPGEIVITNYDILPVTPGEHADAVDLLTEWERQGQPESFSWVPGVVGVADKGRDESRDDNDDEPDDEEEEVDVTSKDISDAQRVTAISPVTPPPPGTFLIADEAHYVRIRRKPSARAKRFRAVAEFVRASGGRSWLLTGTPLLNEPSELWSLLLAAGCAADVFGTWKRFKKLFTKNGKAWVAASHVPELLKRCMLRYEKLDVLKELPPKTRVHVPVEITPESRPELDRLFAEIERSRQQRFDSLFEAEQEKFRKAEEKRRKAEEKKRKKKKKKGSDDEIEQEDEDVESLLRRGGSASPDSDDDDDGETDTDRARAAQEAASEKAQSYVPFDEISKARAILSTAKIPAAFRVVKEYVDRGEPVVVFADHIEPVTQIYEKFGREAGGWALITGATSSNKRTAIVDMFQRGKLRGIAATIGAAGVGITLTRATDAIFIEESWSPEINRQATDRVHRLGQYKNVTIKVLVADHVMDEMIADVNARKAQLIESTISAAARAPDEHVLTEADDMLAAAAMAATAEGSCGAKTATASAPSSATSTPVAPAKSPPKNEHDRKLVEALREIADGRASASSRDRDFAKSLSDQFGRKGELSERQWGAAENMVSKYQQFGVSAGDPAPASSAASHGAAVSPAPQQSGGKREPLNAQEQWAGAALQQLAEADQDFAKEKNAMGFSRYDGNFGHSLANQLRQSGALSDKQWAAAIKLATRYQRQVGEPPSTGVVVGATQFAQNAQNAQNTSEERGSSGERVVRGAQNAQSWHVVLVEPIVGERLSSGVTSQDDVATRVYDPDGSPIVQRFEFPKERYTPEEAAAWVEAHGFSWIRVEE